MDRSQRDRVGPDVKPHGTERFDDVLDTELHEASQFRNLAKLAADIAHDLRSPLNAIVMNLEMLQQILAATGEQESQAVSPARHYATVVEKQLAELHLRLEILLQQIVPAKDVSELLDLGRLIEHIQSLIAPRARHQQVAIAVEALPGPIQVFGNWAQLKNAFLNVVMNSLDAMPDGGTLSVGYSTDNKQVQVVICDSGVGLPLGLETQIFGKHVTTKEFGTGIGLYLSRAIVENHGGTMTCEENLELGTCFCINLPVA